MYFLKIANKKNVELLLSPYHCKKLLCEKYSYYREHRQHLTQNSTQNRYIFNCHLKNLREFW